MAEIEHDPYCDDGGCLTCFPDCEDNFPIGQDLQCDLKAQHDGQHWDRELELLWGRWTEQDEKESRQNDWPQACPCGQPPGGMHRPGCNI